MLVVILSPVHFDPRLFLLRYRVQSPGSNRMNLLMVSLGTGGL